jgi:predicted nicotinamide N-methyase
VELIDEEIELGGRTLRVMRPPQADALIDEEAFDEDEFLPYWAELWPSGVALAKVVAGLPLRGVRVLEIGAGLGLPSLSAALGGADVLATDRAADAVELLLAMQSATGSRCVWSACAGTIQRRCCVARRGR